MAVSAFNMNRNSTEQEIADTTVAAMEQAVDALRNLSDIMLTTKKFWQQHQVSNQMLPVVVYERFPYIILYHSSFLVACSTVVVNLVTAGETLRVHVQYFDSLFH
jgi:hypothetical protein